MAHITREEEIALRKVVQSYDYLGTAQTTVPEVRERIAALKKEHADVPWNPTPKVEVRKGLKGLEASKVFLQEVLDSMKEGLRLKLVTKQWWRANGLDERVPCNVRRLTYFNEWCVKSRVPDPDHEGKKLRVLKPFLQVYDEFMFHVREERGRRIAAINNTPWYTDWEDSMLHSRLRLAAGKDVERCAELCKAKKKEYKVKLALAWELPYEPQADWVEGQRGRPRSDGLPPLLAGRREAPRSAPVRPEEETQVGGSEVASDLGMPIPNLGMLRLSNAGNNPARQASEIDNLPWQRFYSAVKDGDLALVQSLIRHPRVRDRFAESYTDMYGRTVIHIAAWGGNREVMQWLLDERSGTEMRVNQSRHHKWLEARDQDQWTPLFTACWWGQKFAAEALIRFGANIEARDRNGCMPVERAYMGGRNELVEHLITMMVIPPEQNFFRSTVDLEEDPWNNPSFMPKVDGNMFLKNLMIDSRIGSESRRVPEMVISRSGAIASRKLPTSVTHFGGGGGGRGDDGEPSGFPATIPGTEPGGAQASLQSPATSESDGRPHIGAGAPCLTLGV